MTIYKWINFETFLELLENEKINVDLISRIGKSGQDAGRYRNKNLVFQIKKDKIEKLFQKIYDNNYDFIKNK